MLLMERRMSREVVGVSSLEREDESEVRIVASTAIDRQSMQLVECALGGWASG